MISKELLDKFKKLYLEQFNITLTEEEATGMATDLVNLMKVILKPEPKPHSETTRSSIVERGDCETFKTQLYQ